MRVLQILICLFAFASHLRGIVLDLTQDKTTALRVAGKLAAYGAVAGFVHGGATVISDVGYASDWEPKALGILVGIGYIVAHMVCGSICCMIVFLPALISLVQRHTGRRSLIAGNIIIALGMLAASGVRLFVIHPPMGSSDALQPNISSGTIVLELVVVAIVVLWSVTLSLALNRPAAKSSLAASDRW
jgi:hypothetical protein